ncbi:hypothetical protein A3Q56_05220 [Intoshia linei]|uniref:Uncharacterized protein n=1 Tax=Intoshia linei TaxID=1819745 RepID=A0A177AYE7_9BILA|nr:hypothetical protein A3Q56_05220 [Intoshia linei]
MPRQTIVTIAQQKEQILQQSDDTKKFLKIRKTLKKGQTTRWIRKFLCISLKEENPSFLYLVTCCRIMDDNTYRKMILRVN